MGSVIGASSEPANSPEGLEMSEDPQIRSYPARKSEAGSRVIRDPVAAAIYAADKLVNTRDLLG
jgi:hypothetical protein